jgi:hypothetical protein
MRRGLFSILMGMSRVCEWIGYGVLDAGCWLRVIEWRIKHRRDE